MKNMKIIVTLFVASIITASCAISNKNNPTKKYCGYEMTLEEVNEISIWSSQNPSAYEIENGSEIYSEINDSIRSNMPDTTVFELFMSKLTNDEVGIDAIVPNNKQFIEDVACAFMQSTFSSLVPKIRKIRIYSYTNPDGSGDSPFETGIKNKH